MRPLSPMTAAGVCLAAACMFWWQPAAASAGLDYRDFAELDLESLLDQTIVTAGKHAQKISETPVAATVITAEEITASGARSVPELLYRVAGLDVMRTSSSAYDVSARGLNQPGSNAMLVLVDGRSVYEDVYGLTIWEVLTVSLADIKVIEVIKGPGSAMYGANAFAGVINIITFSADEKPGTAARTYVSDLRESQGSLRTAGRRAALSWTGSTTWERSDDWEQKSPQTENVRFNGRLGYALSPRAAISIEGGLSNGKLKLMTENTPLGADGQASFLRSDLKYGSLDIRWYTNYWSMDIDPLTLELVGNEAKVVNRLHDVEFQHAFSPTPETFFLWGSQYRHKRFEYSLQEAVVRQDIFAGFVLGEWKPAEAWMLSFGVRYEHHPLVDGHAAPRGGIVYRPRTDHALRFSYSQAYRDPSYVETYWRTAIELLPEIYQVYRGDTGVASEEIRSFEVGYQGLVTPTVMLNVALYHNQMKGLIAMVPIAWFPSPPAPYPGIPSELSFQNKKSWEATGGEISAEMDLAGWLRLSGFYAYNRLRDAVTGTVIERAPAHSGYGRTAVRLSPAHSLSFTARYRSRTWWDIDGENEKSAQRFLIDAAWHAQAEAGDYRFTLAIENLFDERCRDYPLAIEHRRRLAATIAVGF